MTGRYVLSLQEWNSSQNGALTRKPARTLKLTNLYLLEPIIGKESWEILLTPHRVYCIISLRLSCKSGLSAHSSCAIRPGQTFMEDKSIVELSR